MSKINIAAEIKSVRKKLKLNQEQLASLFNQSEPLELQTHRRDISKYETGRTACPANKYIKLTKLINP